MRTSLTDPLQIGLVSAPGISGAIGITFCPGKKDRVRWDRDLDIDVAAIRAWGASAVVTLIEPHEFKRLAVEQLPGTVARHGMTWVHLPIRDVSVPDHRFEEPWRTAGLELRRTLYRGERIVVHCWGGRGRAGTVAARLLVELGMEPAEAIAAVRQARPEAIETSEQEAHVLACGRIVDPRADGS